MNNDAQAHLSMREMLAALTSLQGLLGGIRVADSDDKPQLEFFADLPIEDRLAASKCRQAFEIATTPARDVLQQLNRIGQTIQDPVVHAKLQAQWEQLHTTVGHVWFTPVRIGPYMGRCPVDLLSGLVPVLELHFGSTHVEIAQQDLPGVMEQISALEGVVGEGDQRAAKLMEAEWREKVKLADVLYKLGRAFGAGIARDLETHKRLQGPDGEIPAEKVQELNDAIIENRRARHTLQIDWPNIDGLPSFTEMLDKAIEGAPTP